MGIRSFPIIDRTVNNYFTIKNYNAYLIAFYPWAGDFAVYRLDIRSENTYGHVLRSMVTTAGNTILSNTLQVSYVSDHTFNITNLDVSYIVIDIYI